MATRDVSEENASTASFADDGSLREYRGYRRMHAWSERGQEAWLDAWTELKDGQFAYRVLSERGSDMVRSRVLHAVLAA